MCHTYPNKESLVLPLRYDDLEAVFATWQTTENVNGQR